MLIHPTIERLRALGLTAMADTLIELQNNPQATEIHDTHHPISGRLYFEDQRNEAKRRATDFLKYRAPKFLRYFELVLEQSGGTYLVGRKLTYADLSLFQIIEGLRYALLRRKLPLRHKEDSCVW